MSDIKQMIVMRTDLGMRKGKMIAQGSHASIAFLTRRMQVEDTGEGYKRHHRAMGFLSNEEKEWLDTSFAKVCVRVGSEEELMEIYEKAKKAGLEVHLVTDSGLTEFHGVPTKTCLAIGPDLAYKIDPITGSLKLL